MKLRDIVEQGIIRFFVYPFHRNEPVDFKTCLKKATHVLISCPAGKGAPSYSTTIKKLTKLFSKKKLILLYPDVEKYSPEKFKIQHVLKYPVCFNDTSSPAIFFPDISKQNLWNLLRSNSMKQFKKQRFDVLLDLDPKFSLINIYLCRLLHPSIRVSFSKPYSKYFYNIQYNGNPDTQYPDRLQGLYRFLRTLLS